MLLFKIEIFCREFRLAGDVEAELAQAHSENAKLKADIDSLGTDESAEKLAREKLGLVKSDEIVFVDMK